MGKSLCLAASISAILLAAAGSQAAAPPPQPAAAPAPSSTQPPAKPAVTPTAPTPAASLFGIPTDDARKIVYVTDRSGDILNLIEWETLRSVMELRPDQEFDILSIRPGPPGEMPARRMVPPTPANILAANEFLETIMAGGMSDFGQAMKRAFALKPDTIFVIDVYDLYPEERDLLRHLNPDKKVKVHVITFAKEYVDDLTKVAAEFGGQCRYVSEEDFTKLRKAPPEAADAQPDKPAGGTVFFGLSIGQARRIIYVYGTPEDRPYLATEELARSILGLRRDQEFNVIAPTLQPEPLLKEPEKASTATKIFAINRIPWVRPKAYPEEIRTALRQAFAMKPDLVFFASGGDLDAAFAGFVKDLNADGKVRVSTVSLTNTANQAVLKQIATESHGEFKAVSKADLEALSKPDAPPSPK